jgi:hypothetical protein
MSIRDRKFYLEVGNNDYASVYFCKRRESLKILPIGKESAFFGGQRKSLFSH